MSLEIYMSLIMYNDYMARKARQQPETVVEQAMVAIRRRQSRRSLGRRAERNRQATRIV